MAVLTLGFILLCFVLFGIPLVFWGFSVAESVLTPVSPSGRESTTELVFPKYEHQLYMEKLKKRRLRRQRFKQLIGL